MFDLQHRDFQGFVSIPHAFASHEVDLIRGLIENRDKVQGTVGDNQIKPEIRDSRIRWLMTEDSAYYWIFQRIAALVNEANAKHFGLDLTATEGIQLTEYDAEYKGFYGVHTDSLYGPYGETRHRKLSITMQLSNPDEYEGGELKLYPANLEPVIGMRDKGTMTLFRSSILHEVAPVTKGRRYSLVTWIHGPLLR